MTEDVYRRLAAKLDAMPNGFPATDSGVELELLAKIFTPEEAALAAELRMTLEPASDIAARNGGDPKHTYNSLKAMVRKGQIRVSRRDRELVFGLMPFVVGIYEEQLPRLDKELAILIEQYFQAAQGTFTSHPPSVHRVIPVEEAVPAGIEIFPYERATQLLEGAKAWAVRECICRLQQHLVGKGCERPTENCLVFAPVAGAFDHSHVSRPISKEEAFRILREAEDAGLVHSPGNYRDGNHYI
jgi:electron transport complex protein RnfB